MRATFDSVVQQLVEKLVLRQRVRRSRRVNSSGDPNLLFVIGAGCSMQYGLPGYPNLLRLLLTEKLGREGVSGETTLQELQKEIEISWRRNPELHREWLGAYLTGIDGRDCLAYRRLARLMKEGLVDGVVNLNFDRLLVEACRAEGLDVMSVANFDEVVGSPMLIEPHGGIGAWSIDPILDLRADQQSSFDRNGMLARSHVVVIGYGSGDDSILDSFVPKDGSMDRLGSLFYFNLEEPQELKARYRLLEASVIRNRGDDLAPFDSSCTFENLMEALFSGLESAKKQRSHGASPRPELLRIDPAFEHFTLSEATALTRCRRLADRLRLAASVADSSPVEIAEHAREIAELAFRLADTAGVRLLPIEKVLLYATALFHDLGYYWSANHERFGRYQGWRIHRLHGAMVSRMLMSWWRENDERLGDYVPVGYHLSETEQHRLVECLFWLCSHHNSLLLTAHRTSEGTDDVAFVLDGVVIKVRRHLLQVLISAAEHLCLEHPFQPSLDPVARDSAELGAIDDPVLHLILVRRRGIRFEVTVEGNEIRGRLAPSWAKKKIAKFFVARIVLLIQALSTMAKQQGGGKIKFTSNVRPEPNWLSGMSGTRGVTACLEESLAEAIDSISYDRIDAHVALLDLVAIYSLGGRSMGRSEPRLDCANSPAVWRAMARVHQSDPHGQRKSLVQEFVLGRIENRRDEIDLEFSRCFESRIFPAWRFVGKKWRDGIEATTTALTTLEMGSSCYRSEVVVGLRRLLREKVEWHGDLAMAHNGCVLCCSRLVMTFSYARLLFSEAELDELVDFRGATLLDALRGLLRYLLCLDEESPRWQGEQLLEGKIAVHSADYLGFAAGATGFFLSTEELIRAHGGALLDLSDRPRRLSRISGTLPSRAGKTAEALLKQRWQALCGLTKQDLLSTDAEEPHSLVLGRIAIVMLSRDYFTPQVASVTRLDDSDKNFAEVLFEAVEDLERQSLSHLGRLNLWPVLLLLDRLRPSEQLMQRNLERYRECRDSPIWVETGAELGSWGFNVRTTAIVCSALNAFWRHVLFIPGNRERYRRLWAEARKAAQPGEPVGSIGENSLPLGCHP